MSANANPQDPLEFVRNMWSSMGFSLPGIMTPTLDPNELDKRIQDLKAVEGWLRMNLNMLSASINTLEVQRATLAALSQGLFQPASFRIDPALLRRLAPNALDGSSAEPQLPLLGLILQIQTRVLDQLFSDRLSTRLLEAELSTAASTHSPASVAAT